MKTKFTIKFAKNTAINRMNQLKYRLKKRIYRLRSRHKKGYGIHSPFMFDLLTNVIEFKGAYYAFEFLEQIRKEQLQILNQLEREGGNQLSDFFKGKRSDLKSGKKIDQLLYRLVNYFCPGYIYHIGGGVGVCSAYLAKVNSRAQVFHVSDESISASFVVPLWRENGIENIKFIDWGDMSFSRSLDFVILSQYVKDEILENLWERLSDGIHDKTVVVVRGIRDSSYRKVFWKKVRRDPKVRVSIDLFGLGFLIFRKGMQKQHYRIPY